MKASTFLSCLALTTGCAEPADGGSDAPPPEPGALVDGVDGKADVASRVTMRPAAEFGRPVTGTFVEDLQFEAFPLRIREGARFGVEITRAGTARSLDAVLFIYGPKAASGYGTAAWARDDDSGWGPHPRLKGLVAPSNGEYLVVVGTGNGQGRGNYRLLATCESGDCALPAVTLPETCPDAVAAGLLTCTAARVFDPALGPAALDRPSPEEALDTCLDAEGFAGPWDAACAEAPIPACEAPFEDAWRGVEPLCRAALSPVARRETCAFGDTWRDLSRTPGLIVTGERTARQVSHFVGRERQQVVAAMAAAGHTDVRTPGDALDRADGNEIHLLHLWHEEAGKAYLGIEFGAGDTSVGALLPVGETTVVAVNSDGDLYDCRTPRGPRGADCQETADCPSGLTCQGRSEASGLGRCVLQDRRAGAGDPCSLSQACGTDTGLVCAGLTRDPQNGICTPAWMRNTFRPALSATLSSAAGTPGLTVPFDVRGLATVDMDVWLNVTATPTAPTGLVVRLVNPDGQSVVVHEGRHGPEGLWLSQPLLGYSGDTYVNGAWKLEFEDRGGVGLQIETATLTIGSRWD
jgi:hypothetical protein